MLAKKLAFGGAVGVVAFFGMAAWHGGQAGGRVSAQPPVEVVPLVDGPRPVHNLGANTVRLANANFIVTADSVEIATQVAETAERLRQTWGVYLFNAAPPRWQEPCAVRVKLAATSLLGVTEFTFDQGKVARMNMTVSGTYERILHSALPHEIVHTLLADAFGKPLPRWLDEGLASQADSRDEQMTLLQRHDDAHKAGRLLPLQQLLELRDYPRDVPLFYAQSYSLTRFLIDQKGLPPLLAFARADLSQGVDAAVSKTFGYPDVASLESAWLKGPPRAKVADIRPRALGTAPSCGRAKMLNDLTISVSVEEEQIDQTARSASGVFTMPERRVVRYAHLLQLADVTAVRCDGRELAWAELRALLQTEQPVLLLNKDVPKFDPMLLALLRPEALVIRLESANLPKQRFLKP